ncbi:MAG: PIN domain-containing protein, partial [Beijerinckiaceae bacterium]
VTEAVALDWGRLSANRSRNTADGLIAATARVHDLILVTRNVIDFEDTGVSIINPWDL